jgi:hypothetical protein
LQYVLKNLIKWYTKYENEYLYHSDDCQHFSFLFR